MAVHNRLANLGDAGDHGVPREVRVDRLNRRVLYGAEWRSGLARTEIHQLRA